MERDLRYAFGTPRGRGPLHIVCPKHDDYDGSLAIYHDHGFCFGGCGYISPEELLKIAKVRAETLPEVSAATAARREGGFDLPPLSLINIWHENLMSPKSPVGHRIEWLLERGIFLSTISAQKLGHTGRYFTIPVWKDGVLIGIRKRRDDRYCDPDGPKYMQPANQPALLYRPYPTGKHTVITEGELDALILAQHQIDAITSTAGCLSLRDMFKGWPGKKPIYVATDQDPAGEIAYESLEEVLPGRVKRLRWRDANDVTDKLRNLSHSARFGEIQSWLSQAGR